MRKLFLVFVSSVGLTACGSSDTWQAIYYPDGCLICDTLVYSHTFSNFKDCRKWAEDKMISYDDKSSCNKNCSDMDAYGMQTCKEVVRSWKAFPFSVTFDEYEE